MGLDTRISVTLRAALNSVLDLGTSKSELGYLKDITLLSGTGTNQADRIFHDNRTINASATDSLDLAGGGLVDPFNAALTIVKLKLVYVYADPANTNNVVVTRPASNGVPLFAAAGDALPVLPGGEFLWVAPGAGITVTPTTADLLDLVNSAGGSQVKCDVVLIGTSA